MAGERTVVASLPGEVHIPNLIETMRHDIKVIIRNLGHAAQLRRHKVESYVPHHELQPHIEQQQNWEPQLGREPRCRAHALGQSRMVVDNGWRLALRQCARGCHLGAVSRDDARAAESAGR